MGLVSQVVPVSQVSQVSPAVVPSPPHNLPITRRVVLSVSFSISIGGWGGSPTGKSFRFVRACERAGEAKLRGRVRGECFSPLGVSILTFPPAVVSAWFLLGFGFSFLLLFTWVLSFFRTDCCYAHGLFDLFLFLMVCSWVF